MQPEIMEALPVSDDNAVKASMDLVDRADLYVGIFAYRYGYVPEGEAKSITHLEYERALERKIPVLAFLIDEDHPVRGADVEKGPGAAKLEELKDLLGDERVVGFFKSPEDLRGLLIDALQRHEPGGDSKPSGNLHHVAEIPRPPERYVAHPYTLLQTRELIGRRRELEHLTDWITRPERFGNASMLCVVGLGGMGKSALTWHWFDKVVEQEMKGLEGRLWWSFYESDARFENFLERTFCYLSGKGRADAKGLSRVEQEDAICRYLDEQRYVLVLDGFERELVAYAGLRAAYVTDEDVGDELAGYIAAHSGLPASTAQSFFGRSEQRRAVDPRVGSFLRRLAKVRSSRILVSTRLFPMELQTASRQPWPGSALVFLEGLSEGDALELWRAHGARGSREAMVPVFNTFGCHPLLIQILAGAVVTHREVPGDFDAWSSANPDFDPFALPLVQVRSHVLATALKGLSEKERHALHVLAGFRMPTGIETLKALLVRSEDPEVQAATKAPFNDFVELDRALGTLEDRGLVGWDRRANRYDLHPIVRGVVWSALDDEGQTDVNGAFQKHFDAIPPADDEDVESLEDLSPSIELFHALVGLGRYRDALSVSGSFIPSLYYRLGAGSHLVGLIRCLLPDGRESASLLSDRREQSLALNRLGLGLMSSGQPASAVSIFERCLAITTEQARHADQRVAHGSVAWASTLVGELFHGTSSALRALEIARTLEDGYEEEMSLQQLGATLTQRGHVHAAEVACLRALRIKEAGSTSVYEGGIEARLAKISLLEGHFDAALERGQRTLQVEASRRLERDFIRATRLVAQARVGLGEFHSALEGLIVALSRARSCGLVEEELASLVALAGAHQVLGEPGRSRELLEDAWYFAERGPYPLHHADALNVLAALERDAGHDDAGVEAATRAYQLSWCQGPPYAYHQGLETARRHLAELGAPEPELPPFDPSEHPEIPDVEIDPDDEFRAEPEP